MSTVHNTSSVNVWMVTSTLREWGFKQTQNVDKTNLAVKLVRLEIWKNYQGSVSLCALVKQERMNTIK